MTGTNVLYDAWLTAAFLEAMTMSVQPLRRVLGPLAVVAFAVTNQIAAGLFFVSTQVQLTVPGVGTLVPWLMLAGGALTLLVALAYRFFFARQLIGPGGEYVMLRSRLGTQWAFLATLMAWFGMTGSLGTLAFVAAHFLSNACAGIGWNGAASALASAPGTLVCGLVLLWSVWLVHVRGVRIAALLTVASMVFVVAVALTVTAYGFATTPAQLAAALHSRLHLSFEHAQMRAALAPSQAASAALPLLFYGYLGLSTATQTGGEAIDAQRSLTRGVFAAVFLVTIVYTLFCFAVYHAVPWFVIGMLAQRGLTTYTTATGIMGLVMPRWLDSLMNLFVAIVVVKTFLPIFLAQSRWIYAWGSDGVIPQRLAQTHPRYGTPVIALTVSAALGSLALFESVALGYVFGVSLRVFSAMIVFFSIGIAVAASRTRAAHLALAFALIAFSGWFAFGLLMAARTTSLWLNPAVQAAIVAAIGFALLRSNRGPIAET